MPGHSQRHSAVSCAKMAELIEMPFGLWTRMGQRKHVLRGGAHGCRLVNMIELSTCGGDAAFLSKYFEHLFRFWFKNHNSSAVLLRGTCFGSLSGHGLSQLYHAVYVIWERKRLKSQHSCTVFV